MYKLDVMRNGRTYGRQACGLMYIGLLYSPPWGFGIIQSPFVKSVKTLGDKKEWRGSEYMYIETTTKLINQGQRQEFHYLNHCLQKDQHPKLHPLQSFLQEYRGQASSLSVSLSIKRNAKSYLWHGLVVDRY